MTWPVTVGADISWNILEVWDPRTGGVADFQFISKYMDPCLAREVREALASLPAGADNDTKRTRLATYLLKEYKPNLMLVHLGDLDHIEHGHGPISTETQSTRESANCFQP